MPKSDYAANLATILSEVNRQLLKGKGFKKKGNTFNRITADGLTQVLGFQAGQYVKSEYGTFVVNSGVFVPEVSKVLAHEPKEFKYDYDCEYALRGRVAAGRDGNGNEIWFSLSDDPIKTADILIPLIEQECSEFLNKLESRDQVITYLKARPKSSNDRIVLAIMLLEEGDTDRAASLLQDQYDQAADIHGHRQYVVQLAQRLKLPILDHKYQI